MFKHDAKKTAPAEAKEQSAPGSLAAAEEVKPAKPPAEVSLPALKELLEKNLKWSQIIYEQNRKLNRKLIWTTLGIWLPFILIVLPLIFGVIYLKPMIGNLLSNYGSLFTQAKSGAPSAGSLKNALDLLPINAVEREQLKALLK